jgi:hypothetical protein
MLFSAGSLLEIHYVLMTFGIPTKLLPVTDKGEVAWQHHYDWISSRRSIEAKNLEAKEKQTTLSDETNKDDCIDVPRPSDVLMGSRKVQSHTGNKRYKLLIDDYQENYDACETKIEKTIIASVIVMKVKEYGGRFLSRKEGETNWYEADDWVVREKVTNAFRGRRKAAATSRLKRINNDVLGTSSTSSKRQLPDVSDPLQLHAMDDINDIWGLTLTALAE